MNTLKSLLCRSSLLPGESLSSLLVRLTHLNAYDRLSVIRGLCLGGQKDSFNNPCRPETYERLAILTRLPVIELYNATSHPFANVTTPSDKQIEYIEFPNEEKQALITRTNRPALFPYTDAQFCPKCLQEAPYHHRAWVPKAVKVCLKHQCLLVHRCPQCGTKLAIQHIVAKACPQCRMDLTESPIISLSEDIFGLFVQHIIQCWFEITPPPTKPWLHTLPEESPRVLYGWLI